MKIELSIPLINVICDGLKTLQQQTAVALESIAKQVQEQQAAEADAASANPQDAPAALAASASSPAPT